MVVEVTYSCMILTSLNNNFKTDYSKLELRKLLIEQEILVALSCALFKAVLFNIKIFKNFKNTGILNIKKLCLSY